MRRIGYIVDPSPLGCGIADGRGAGTASAGCEGSAHLSTLVAASAGGMAPRRTSAARAVLVRLAMAFWLIAYDPPGSRPCM